MADLELYYDWMDKCWYIADDIGKYGYDNYDDAKEHFEAILKEIKENL